MIVFQIRSHSKVLGIRALTYEFWGDSIQATTYLLEHMLHLTIIVITLFTHLGRKEVPSGIPCNH